MYGRGIIRFLHYHDSQVTGIIFIGMQSILQQLVTMNMVDNLYWKIKHSPILNHGLPLLKVTV